VLSEEITNPTTGEKVDRLRAMVRSMTTNKQMQDKILDRILGKVVTPVDITTNGKDVNEIGVKIVDYRNDIAPTEDRPNGDSGTSSQDKSSGNGA
jgi:hypothetical protein